MKKVLIYAGIGILIVGLVIALWPKKKPCPCTKKLTTEEAIAQMSGDDLKTQILAIKKDAKIEGLNEDQLRSMLLDIVKSNQ